MKKTKEPVITLSEWKKEIDKLRKPNRWTPEVDEIILYSVDKKPRVRYVDLAEYLTKKYGIKYSRTGLQNRYQALKNPPK